MSAKHPQCPPQTTSVKRIAGQPSPPPKEDRKADDISRLYFRHGQSIGLLMRVRDEIRNGYTNPGMAKVMGRSLDTVYGAHLSFELRDLIEAFLDEMVSGEKL